MNRLPLLFLLLPLLAGCDVLGGSDDPDRVVEGVNLTRLFAPPRADELAAVRADWAARDVSAQGVRELVSERTRLGGEPVTLRIVAHTVGGVEHVGAIVVPEGAAPGSLPVLVYTHGGDSGIDVDEEVDALLLALTDLQDDFVFVIPSYRSEDVEYDGRSYRSDGPASPWDRDVDDALALLNVALATTPEADASRLGVLGASRGATVAMLMAIRDPRIDLVVEYFGPTDFQGAFVQEVVEEALRSQPRDLPGLDHLVESVLEPLRAGALPLEAARLELIRRSILPFAEDLPRLQAHHGRADDVVPVAETEALIARMQALGRTPPLFESYLYDNQGHFPPPLSVLYVNAFLRHLLTPALAAR